MVRAEGSHAAESSAGNSAESDLTASPAQRERASGSRTGRGRTNTRQLVESDPWAPADVLARQTNLRFEFQQGQRRIQLLRRVRTRRITLVAMPSSQPRMADARMIQTSDWRVEPTTQLTLT